MPKALSITRHINLLFDGRIAAPAFVSYIQGIAGSGVPAPVATFDETARTIRLDGQATDYEQATLPS